MSVPDTSLLHEIHTLRTHLIECLNRLDHVESQLCGGPAPSERVPASDADLFEHALPTPAATRATAPATPDEAPPAEPTRMEDDPGHFTIRSVALLEAPYDEADFGDAPYASAPRGDGWAENRPSGDGFADPFAFVHVPLVAPAGSSEVYRGMDALLGGLDVTTQDNPA